MRNLPRDIGFESVGIDAWGVEGKKEEFGEWTSDRPVELVDDAWDVFDKRCARDIKSRDSFRNGFLQIRSHSAQNSINKLSRANEHLTCTAQDIFWDLDYLSNKKMNK